MLRPPHQRHSAAEGAISVRLAESCRSILGCTLARRLFMAISHTCAISELCNNVAAKMRTSRTIPSRLLRSCLFLAWTSISISAHGQASQFQVDPVEHYGARFLTVVIVIGIAVVLFSLIGYRGRTFGPISWALLVLGVAILPAISSGFGTVIVFERAERVEFCNSCHLTMKGFVNDMKDPKSESLAAIHYKNRYIPDDQCYVCHTSYGIFGTVEAKKEGMIDVYKYFTRTFHLPVKLRHPYPNHDCLKCHSESAKWLASHGDYKDALFSGDMTCMQCHGDQNPAHKVAQNVAANTLP